MYKLQTNLSYFRFNTNVLIGDIPVTWYVLDQDDDMTETGRCFTKEELDKFLEFINTNPHHFPGRKNYFECTEEEDFPFCSIYSLIPSNNLQKPKNIILRKSPQLSHTGEFFYCMDIMLTNHSKIDNHHYTLEFGVIGKLE